MKFLTLIAAGAVVSGCADPSLQRVYEPETGFTYTNVKSGCEAAGGPRQDIIVITDRSGHIREKFSAAGPCTVQTVGDALAKFLTLIAAGAVVSGCADPSLQRVYEPETGFTYTNVKSGCEAAGGPRQDIIVITDRSGHIREKFSAAGPCTVQTVGDALAGSLPMAAGVVGAAAVLRPAPTTVNTTVPTTVNTTVSDQLTGGNIAPGAAAATANPSTIANGGIGYGGKGGRGGIGGNASATGGAGGNATGGNATGGIGYGGNATAAGGSGYGGNANARATGGKASALSAAAAYSESKAAATATEPSAPPPRHPTYSDW
jgi:hypothetical protein